MGHPGRYVRCSRLAFSLRENTLFAPAIHWSTVVISFPTRISLPYTLLFSALLVLVELLEGTDPRYSGLVFCFFLLSTLAFNVAGGFSRPSGAYIFFFSTLVVEVGTVYKAMLGQPAQSNLQEPLLMMSLYVACAAGLLLVAFITRKIATTTEGVASLMTIKTIDFSQAALGCGFLYCLLTFGPEVLPGLGGQLLTSLSLINVFLPLTILLGTVGAIRDSGGRRSTNAFTWLALSYGFVTGLLSFSKQGILTPMLCWVLGIAWARFRLRPVHIISLLLFAGAVQFILVPIAQTGRNEIVDTSWSGRIALVESDLENYTAVRKQYNGWTPPSDDDLRMYYYGEPRGIMDRLSMMPNDSVLMQWTDQGHLFGYLALEYYFENLVPHVIAPHKLEGIHVGGNAYMHEMGGLAENDVTTGISFSPAGEAFHIDGWRGILLIAPGVWLLLFVSMDATCGDIRKQPLGLLYILAVAHVAPEGGVGAAIDLTRLVNAAFIFGLFFCGYIAPTLGMLLRSRSNFVNQRPVHRPGAANFDTEALSAS